MKSNSMFLTIVICVLLTVLRIIAEQYSIQDGIVFIINIIALAYVLWMIFTNTYNYINAKKNENQFWKERYRRYIKFILNFIVIIFVILGIYVWAIWKVTFIKKIAGCINDVLSIVTLGISIEDGRIVDKLKNYYENLT